MENLRKIIFKLSEKELNKVQLFLFYRCSTNKKVVIEEIGSSGIKVLPSLEFINEHLERVSEDSIKVKFPKGFLRLFRKIFGDDLGELILNADDLREIDDLECIHSIIISENQLITNIYCNSAFDKDGSERYLSIDLGIKNPVTAVDSETGHCMILGRDYMSRSYYFDKKIQELINVYIGHGLDNFETKKMKGLIDKKENTLSNILHKITRYLTDYCTKKNVTQVVVGAIKEKPGCKFPYNRFFKQLKKKLKAEGIKIVKQNEYLTSQCPPDSPEISREYASKANRQTRGLFKDGKRLFNADGLGAFNILRSYLSKFNKKLEIPLSGIESPKIVIVSD